MACQPVLQAETRELPGAASRNDLDFRGPFWPHVPRNRRGLKAHKTEGGRGIGDTNQSTQLIQLMNDRYSSLIRQRDALACFLWQYAGINVDHQETNLTALTAQVDRLAEPQIHLLVCATREQCQQARQGDKTLHRYFLIRRHRGVSHPVLARSPAPGTPACARFSARGRWRGAPPPRRSALHPKKRRGAQPPRRKTSRAWR